MSMTVNMFFLNLLHFYFSNVHVSHDCTYKVSQFEGTLNFWYIVQSCSPAHTALVPRCVSLAGA